MNRLAVVIPTLDEAELLPRLLARLNGVSGAGAADCADRIVVADGGSQDETVALAEQAGAHVVRAPRGRGPQLAAGAEAAGDCDVLLFLHADALPASGALRVVREAFENSRTQVTAMRQKIEADGIFFRSNERFANFRSRRLQRVWGDCGLGVRRELYESVGGFADLVVFEDVDLSRRLKRAGGRVQLLADAPLYISARRWQREGRLRCTARNVWLTLSFLAGRDPKHLASAYPAHAELRS